jgi:hypothetical protein
MRSIGYVLLVLAAALLPAAASAQQPAQQPPKPTIRHPDEPNDVRPWAVVHQPLLVRAPAFEDFHAGPRYTGRAAAVDLSSAPGARSHRTVLRAAAARGPSFAGHYAVATWGCGTACQRFAIIDVRTGKVWISPTKLARGARFRVDSRLFVLDPLPAGTAPACGSSVADPCPSYLMLAPSGRLVTLDGPESHS